VSDANKVAMPAGWPNNELIKDKVIVPPPVDIAVIEKRRKEYESFDWWFCYKNLD
jgi:peroxiredoxin (alkyl hydroperoxide reductase subunit C)